MRISLCTFILILICLEGCSQFEPHDFHMPGKIPIDAKRWYQLNAPVKSVADLFDNIAYQKIDDGHGHVLQNYDIWYPVLDGEQMTIDSIMMFDWEGINGDRPMTIYAILNDGKKVPIAVFTGLRYGKWSGPDPNRIDVFALDKPVRDIRYLVINTWGDFPSEIEFYGSYTPPALTPWPEKRATPLRNYFGVNAFEWDFSNPGDPLNLDPVRLNAVRSFTGVRHYLDWEKLEHTEGKYTFRLAQSGSWNYDTIYHWCKAQGIDVLACIKTVPEWMQTNTPSGERGNENVPARYGKNLSDPASYIEQAKLGFQYAARYGNNKNVDRQLVHVDSDMEPWPNGPRNYVRIGLGLVSYIECDNERDKWWQGRRAYQTGREYAANLSAFYDGHKNTLGPGVGVKNADPEMKVVMAGLAAPTVDYVRGMIDWSLQNRGRRPDGSADLPWDVINYHYYCNDAGYMPDKKQTSGCAPELTNASATAVNFVQMAHKYASGMPVWVTETGYDLNQKSAQRAFPIGKRTALETQADWSLRTIFTYARAGIQRVYFYELLDDNPKSDINFATSGLINADRSRRPVADYMFQVNKLFGAYSYEDTKSNDPVVDHYVNGSQSMFVVFVPDQKGRTKSYVLDLGTAPTAFIYTLKTGSENMEMTTQNTVNGKIEIIATETPVFVTSLNCYKP